MLLATRILPRWMLALAALPLLVAPTAPASTTGGNAETSNAILSLSLGDTTVMVGQDAAEASRGSEAHARATFTAGGSTDTSLGTLESSGTTAEDTGSDQLAGGALTLDGLVELDVVDATTSVVVAADHVASSASATLADASLLDGLITLEGFESATAAQVTGDSAQATRIITLNGLQVFDLRGLLAALGLDELQVPCEGIEGAGSALGVDTGQACEQLAAATDALADARAALDGIADDLDAIIDGHDRTQIEADRASAAALSCAPLDLACVASALATLTTLASTYDVTLTDPTSISSSVSQIVGAMDELLAAHDDRGIIGDAIDEAGQGTCDTTDTALAEAVSGLSSADPADAGSVLSAARVAAAEACDDLRATNDEVMATPVVTMDDVVITLVTSAADGETTAGVFVAIGSVRVGVNEAIAVADLSSGLSSADAIAEAISAVVDGLNLGIPTPEIELFAVDTAEGQEDDGDWFSQASLAVLQITQEAAALAVSDDPPMAILGEAEASGAGAGGPMFGAAPRALLAAIVDTPPIVARAVVFDAAAAFGPAAAAGGGGDDDPGSDDGGDPGSSDPGDPDGPPRAAGDPLPVTGLADRFFALLAAVMILGAGAVRRWLALS